MTKKQIKADPLVWMDKEPAKEVPPAMPAHRAKEAEPARVKVTYRIQARHAELIKAQCYWDRLNQRELMDSILEAHLKIRSFGPIRSKNKQLEGRI